MLEVCIRCGIGENLVIQSNKTFICRDCSRIVEEKESTVERGGLKSWEKV